MEWTFWLDISALGALTCDPPCPKTFSSEGASSAFTLHQQQVRPIQAILTMTGIISDWSGTVLVSQDYHYKIPQTESGTLEIYLLTNLEAGSSKSRSWQV